MQTLDRAAFDRLPTGAADLVHLYYGLNDARAWTKRELADRFGLTVWRVDRILQESVPRLLDPSAEIAPSLEVALQRKAENIGPHVRRRGTRRQGASRSHVDGGGIRRDSYNAERCPKLREVLLLVVLQLIAGVETQLLLG